jgi:hypothetical protein
MANGSGPFAVLSVFLFGVVAGGVTALLLGTDDNGNTKAAVKARIKYTKDHIGEGELWIRNQAGEVADYLEEKFAGAQKMLEAKLKVIRERYGKIDQEKYAKAVNEVVDQLKSSGEVTLSQAKTISKYLMDDYHTLAVVPAKKAAPKTGAKKTAK